MEIILLGIYSALVWLIFIKFKWLPWNTGTQVTVVIIPIVGLAFLILLLNVAAPSTADVRVIKYVVNVVPQVRGRVLEVPVEPNRLVKRGEPLFRIDPTPYELNVRALEAQLANTSASGRELDEQLAGASARSRVARRDPAGGRDGSRRSSRSSTSRAARRPEPRARAARARATASRSSAPRPTSRS
jgi:multidrug resistance efflux pump